MPNSTRNPHTYPQIISELFSFFAITRWKLRCSLLISMSFSFENPGLSSLPGAVLSDTGHVTRVRIAWNYGAKLPTVNFIFAPFKCVFLARTCPAGFGGQVRCIHL